MKTKTEFLQQKKLLRTQNSLFFFLIIPFRSYSNSKELCPQICVRIFQLTLTQFQSRGIPQIHSWFYLGLCTLFYRKTNSAIQSTKFDKHWAMLCFRNIVFDFWLLLGLLVGVWQLFLKIEWFHTQREFFEDIWTWPDKKCPRLTCKPICHHLLL